ncbi:MAG: ABC transporter permease [Limimaricola sp.]|uniref:ABC transporter permease n=1 Tax=Limimaricola sp. TaxID=2211665 RepID=UPI001D4F396B|nr:ABC transporter permease [Limimaricola sp.]MBI1416588.1 ABC transporter permease [Limimaricola sp.]
MGQVMRRYGTAAGMAAIVVFFAVALPDTFLTLRNWLNISQQISMLAVVAVTMTVVMVMGDFDLSVGSMASLAGVVAAVAFTHGWPVWAGVGAALAVGLLGGLFNGLLVSVVGILPFVATLATLTMYSGFAFLMSGGKTIFGRDIPAAFSGFARGGITLGATDGRPLVLPWLTLLALGVTAAIWLVLEQTAFGRRLYGIGGNAVAARLAGVKVMRLRLLAFGFTGVGAATAGLMYAARVASANPTQGSGLMLTAIAAVFLGMTMSAFGQPRVLATLAGVVVLGVMDNGLTQLHVDSYVRDVVVGAIIVLAVSISAFGRRATGG